MTRDKLLILVISSDPSAYESIYWNIIQAKSEKEALDKYSKDINVIIAETSVPFDFSKVIRKKEEGIRIPPIISVASNEILHHYEQSLIKGATAFISRSNFCDQKSVKDIIELIAEHHNQYHSPIELKIESTYLHIQRKIKRFLTSFDHNKNTPILLEGEDGTGKMYWIKMLAKKVALRVLDVRKLNEQLPGLVDWSEAKDEEIYFNNGSSKDIRVTVLWGIECADYVLQKQILKWLKTKPCVIFVCRGQISDSLSFLIQELYDIIIRNPFTLDPLTRRQDDIESLIQNFLIEESVCPRHLPFFGKTISEVFEQDAIKFLKKYNWNSNLRELKEVIRLVICKADLDGSSLIKHEYLPIKIINQGAGLSDWSSDKIEGHQWLENFIKLFRRNSQEEISRILRMSKKEIFGKLRKICRTYPSLFNSSEIKMILEERFKIDAYVFLVYASESEYFANLLKKQLVSVKIKVKDIHGFLPGEDVEEEIHKANFGAELILAMLCSDFLNHNYYDNLTKVHDEDKQNERKRIIPILTRPCHWESSIFGGFVILPKEKKPIKDHDDIDNVVFQVSGTVVDMLNERGII